MKPEPHNFEAERAVLGGLLIKPSAFDEVATDLQVHDFFLPAHREIYAAMLTIGSRGGPVGDPIAVADELRKRELLQRLDGGASYLLKLSNSVPTAENIGHYKRIVKEKATLRRLIAACARTQSLARGDIGEFDVFLRETNERIQRVAQVVESSTDTGLVCFADVEPRDVDWLWPGRIPMGMLTILDGPSSLGKSSVTVDLAARITTGGYWPASLTRCERSDVLFLGQEDSPNHTVRPRLDAAGADVRRCHLLSEVRGRFPRLPEDADEFERRIRDTGARLMIIDPITAYVGKADINRDNEVRNALTPLAGVAERTGAAIVMIRHIRKSGGVDALNRGLGSVAITAVARASMMLLKDPEDPEARILAWPKMNVAALPRSLRWYLAPQSNGKPPRIVWDDLACDLSADDILERQDGGQRGEHRGVVDATADWLRDVLAAGPVASQSLESRSQAAGHGRGAYKRARTQLGVVSTKRGATWFSALPASSRDSDPGQRQLGSLDTVDPLALQGVQGIQESNGLHLRGDASLAGEDVV